MSLSATEKSSGFFPANRVGTARGPPQGLTYGWIFPQRHFDASDFLLCLWNAAPRPLPEVAMMRFFQAASLCIYPLMPSQARICAVPVESGLR